MDAGGEWRSDSGLRTTDGLTFYQGRKKVDPPPSVACHIWAAYSPWTTWAKIAGDFIKTKGDPVRLKTWINTTLGEAWEEAGAKIEGHNLYMRREHYPATVPQKACVIVAGVDTQDDRLEASAWAFGGDNGTESWLVDHSIFWGDPGQPELWNRLDDWLMQSWEHESGAQLRIAAGAVDSGGHYTDAVYKFCKARERRRIYAIKGSNQRAQPIISRPSKANKAKLNLFSVGTDTAKEMVFGRLNIPNPGPGYVHFPISCDEEYFEQLTGEKRVTEYVKGRPVKVFKPTRARNEALDCFVYALAAIEILNPSFKILAKRLEVESDDSDSPGIMDKPAQPEEQRKTTQNPRRRTRPQKNWATDF